MIFCSIFSFNVTTIWIIFIFTCFFIYLAILFHTTVWLVCIVDFFLAYCILCWNKVVYEATINMTAKCHKPLLHEKLIIPFTHGHLFWACSCSRNNKRPGSSVRWSHFICRVWPTTGDHRYNTTKLLRISVQHCTRCYARHQWDDCSRVNPTAAAQWCRSAATTVPSACYTESRSKYSKS